MHCNLGAATAWHSESFLPLGSVFWPGPAVSLNFSPENSSERRAHMRSAPLCTQGTSGSLRQYFWFPKSPDQDGLMYFLKESWEASV